MITNIIAKEFKGLTFEQPLEQYNLFYGPNGIGKSARTQALALAVMGYNPTDQMKRPSDIIAAHCPGDKFAVGFQKVVNDVEQTFSR